MTRWALIAGGVVANVVEQDGQPQIAGQWLACGNAGPGWSYDGAQFAPPPAPPAPQWSDASLDARYWWVDVGPFFDRFGAKALAVTSSADAQVQGLVTLVMPRQYVDLKRADLPGMLDLLITKSLITAGDKTSILMSPTTEYERHVKGLPQPQ